jgi:hypothetical protein
VWHVSLLYKGLASLKKISLERRQMKSSFAVYFVGQVSLFYNHLAKGKKLRVGIHVLHNVLGAYCNISRC